MVASRPAARVSIQSMATYAAGKRPLVPLNSPFHQSSLTASFTGPLAHTAPASHPAPPRPNRTFLKHQDRVALAEAQVLCFSARIVVARRCGPKPLAHRRRWWRRCSRCGRSGWSVAGRRASSSLEELGVLRSAGEVLVQEREERFSLGTVDADEGARRARRRLARRGVVRGWTRSVVLVKLRVDLCPALLRLGFGWGAGEDQLGRLRCG